MSTAAVEPAPATTEPNEKVLLPLPTTDTASDAPSSTTDLKEAAAPEPTGPTKKPFAHPLETCKPAAPAPLTADQQSKYDELLKTVKSWDTLPKTSAKNAETAPLSDDEKIWLTRECLLRYLRATKWNLSQAEKRVRESIVWRREFGVDGLTKEYISDENATGKQVILGFDNDGRPCLYLLPNKQNTKNSPKQVEHLVFMLERVLDVAPPGQETLALLIDFRNSSNSSNPSLATSKQCLNILQNHYPERLGRALITHLPWYVLTFFKLITPFIDPNTKPKLKFNEPLPSFIPKAQLMNTSGGDVHFEYEHDVYWPALNELAEQRRKERRDRWEKAGKHVGENETYLKGGAEKSVSAVEGSQDAVNGAATPAAATADAAAAAPVEEMAKLEVKDGKEGEDAKAEAKEGDVEKKTES
ncbi:CRAL/TRIO domain-containing protein [Zopfia rhizophila CBS 207.26]|uniref:CRAL/TRIO domain-containing protein n=1 Tax=Zopfia rhizophila CBS 207.26 TaxID=1314779 RepID=A0A6A6EER1_9PEZI|nr:CRAL/TRIO domain-containing protein [Zopfia rhizophila CBS 207.26]